MRFVARLGKGLVKRRDKRFFLTFKFWSVIPSIIFIILLLILGFYVGWTQNLFAIFSIFLLLFTLPQIFKYETFAKGEQKIKYDNLELIKLEKNHAVLWLGIINGLGFTLLISGLVNFPQNQWFVVAGLFILSIANFYYYYFYYFPRYALLIRKSKMIKKS